MHQFLITRNSPVGALFLLTVLVLVLSGCAIGPNFKRPQTALAEKWMAEGQKQIIGKPADQAEWWKAFNDPVLDALVAQAQRQNLTLQWELDVWGRKRRLIEAADASYQATIADYDGILVSLTAEVAATYIQIRTLEERLRATREDITALERFLSAAQAQAHEARVTDLDVQMARTLLTATQAEIPAMESELRVAENSLCVLLAKPPQDLRQELGGPGRIPTPPREVAAGVPADLLRRRPDVRMAEYAAWSQCARIGVAKGELLPSFSLFGALGFASSHTGNFFDHDSFRNVYGGGFNWNPIIYPFTIEPVRLQDAKFQETIAEY